MTLDDFLANQSVPGPPWFYISDERIRELESFLWPPTMLSERGAVVRWVRAEYMQNLDDFHREISAALQFPSYYGKNWDAFRDCLRDLAWGAGTSYLLVVWECEKLLRSESDDQLSIFGRQLGNFAQELMEPYQAAHDSIRPSTSIHVILQTETALAEPVRSRLQRAGIVAEELKNHP